MLFQRLLRCRCLPRRGKEDAIEKQIAGKWHLITLQGASEYVEHEILHERFHGTHFAGCAVLFNKDTCFPDISVKSIYLHDTRRARSYCWRRTWMGFTRRSVTCLFSSCCSQWSEGLHCLIAAHQQYLCQEKRYCQENHPDHSCSYDLSKHWFSYRRFQWHRLALSQPRQYQYYRWSIFLTVPCLRCRSLHHCGDLDPYRTIGRTSVVFLSHPALNDFGKWTNMAPFPFLDKLLVYVPVIKAAIMRRGFMCISSIGTTKGTIKLTTTGTFALRNGLRALEIELQNATSAKYWATTRSHLDCATTCAPGSHGFPCSSSRSDLMSFNIRFHLECFSCDLLIMILMCTLSNKMI